MDYLDIPQPPDWFADEDLHHLISIVPLDTTSYTKPVVVPNHSTTNTKDFSITVRIQQAKNFSFLMDDGVHVDGITFKDFKDIDDTKLRLTLIADGRKPLLKFVTLEFETAGPYLQNSYFEFTYWVE